MSRLVDIALFERYGDSYIVYSTDDSGNKRTIQTSELATVSPNYCKCCNAKLEEKDNAE